MAALGGWSRLKKSVDGVLENAGKAHRTVRRLLLDPNQDLCKTHINDAPLRSSIG